MNKAELLWLYYDYHTEKFDQQLPNVSSPNDEGGVIPTGDYRYVSDKHAMSMKQAINEVAEAYRIPKEKVEEEKRYRMRETTKRRLERYEWITENRPEEFQFITDYFERKYYEDTIRIQRATGTNNAESLRTLCADWDGPIK